jgi:hypothetical protein
MVGPSTMKHLRQLLGDDEFNKLAKPSRRPKGASFALNAQGQGWDEWRRVFDEAIGLMLPLLTPIDKRDRRKILASKLELPGSEWMKRAHGEGSRSRAPQ